MQALEVAVVAITGLVLVLAAIRRPRRGRWWPEGSRWPAPETAMAIALLAPLVLHLLVDGYRTVMIPAYTVCAGLLLLLGLRARRAGRIPTLSEARRHPRLRALGRVITVLLGLVALATSALSATLLPVFELPAPEGPYAVGRTDLHLTDMRRQEWATSADDDVREVVASVWYPAEPAAARGAATEVLGDEIAQSVAGSVAAAVPSLRPAADVLGAPLDHLQRIATHAVRDAEAAAHDGDGFPVVLYSPGLASSRFENVALMEDLASRGYVVVAVDHPYTSGSVTLAGGAEATVDPVLLGPGSDATVRKRLNDWIDTRVEDLSTVLDHLAALETRPGSVLQGVMDLETVGAVGFSLGGDTVTQALTQEPRLDAAVSLDGPYLGKVSTTGVPAPFLNVIAADHLTDLEQDLETEQETGIASDSLNRYRGTMSSASGPVWVASVEGTTHLSHTVFPLISPILGGEAGTGRAQVDTVETLVVDFLDHALAGAPARLLGQGGDIPLTTRFLPDPRVPRT
ncbi:alpha/beta hydrolase family protein [Actinomyces sp. zg328]|uniref:alpha/beta hydrolase family protein n=1 Tax=Actinomyces sp. zg328 TaxID=2609287 RepID=UPI00135B3461|nr:hypothetical protein [Actinomyces sp. zg328]